MYSLNLTSVNDKHSLLEDYLYKVSLNDKDAFGLLYEEIRVAVYNFAFSIVKNRHLAEDILQETAIKIYESAGDYKAKGKPMAWILTITRNNALMKIRSNNKIQDISDVEWNKIKKEENLTKEDVLFLRSSLEKLSDIERQIITLSAVSGLKHREIAHILKLPLTTTLSKYHRAIKKLRSIMGEEDNNER